MPGVCTTITCKTGSRRYIYDLNKTGHGKQSFSIENTFLLIITVLMQRLLFSTQYMKIDYQAWNRKRQLQLEKSTLEVAVVLHVLCTT